MGYATRRDEHSHIKETAGGVVNPGDIKNFANLGAGVYQGLKAAASGDEVCYDLEGVYEIVAASALTGSVGALVEWDDTAKEVVADAAGDFDIGRLVKAKTSGQTTVWVKLNA